MALFVLHALFNELLPSTEPITSTATYNAGPSPSLYVSATNTNFVQGTTQVMIPGLIIGSISVLGPGSLIAEATRDATKPAGPESVVVTGRMSRRA